MIEMHKMLFGSVYPWTGQDRLETAPNVNITRRGYDRSGRGRPEPARHCQ